MFSRNEFAQAVLAGLTRAGVRPPPHYDELAFCFVRNGAAAEISGKVGYLRLEPWYGQYQQAASQGRGNEVIDHVVRFWSQPAEIATRPLDTSRLVPLVRARFDFAVTALRLAALGQADVAAQVDQIAWSILADHFAVVLAEDSPDTFRHATRQELSQAGLTFESALPLALRNLQQVEPAFAAPRPFAPAAGGQTWVPAHHSPQHNAAWLLAPNQIAALPVAGQHIAFVPFPDSFAVTGSDNHAELRRLATTSLSLLQSRTDKPIVSIPLVLSEVGRDSVASQPGTAAERRPTTGRQWLPWLPPVSHPLYWVIKGLWYVHENSLYEEQTNLLKQRYENQDGAPYIASYKALASEMVNGERKIGTFVVWTETLDTLLPKADVVVLTKLLNAAELEVNENAEPQLGEKITISWRQLAAYLGPRLKPQGMYPERYLVSGRDFPAGVQWQQLAAAQVQLPVEMSPGYQPQAATAAPQRPAIQPPMPAAPAPYITSPVAQPSYVSAPVAPAKPAAPLPSYPQYAPQPTLPTKAYAPRRQPMWPIALAIGIPVGGLAVVALVVVLIVSFSWPRPQPAAPGGFNFPQVPQVNVRGQFQMPPPFEIQAPWSELGEFPALGKAEAPLPKLSFSQDDLITTGPAASRGADKFRDVSPEGGWLVGMRVVRGHSWGGALHSLQPIYQVEDQYQLGTRCGPDKGFAQLQVLAKAGYAVSKIECRQGLVTNAVRLTFSRVKEDKLDQADSYSTDWLGSDGGGPTPPLGGNGHPLVGISGSSQEDLVGLQGFVALPLPKIETPLPAVQGDPRRGIATEGQMARASTDQAPPGGWLVGMRIFQGEGWGGASQAVQPIYQVGDRYVLGTRHGLDGGEVFQFIAPPGYAVGEIVADQGLIVHRLQLKYQRVKDGKLDPTDVKTSPQVGVDGGQQHSLSSSGRPIVGLYLRIEGDIRALGLMVAD